MLSICIPIFNFDATDLLTDLQYQVNRVNVPVEIVCIDDCSSSPFVENNKEICSKSGTYIQLNCNIGRAKIRNLFLEHTKYEYLLFIDCDSVIISPHFIEHYLNAICEDTTVICGGRVYSEKKPPRQNLLRWQFGRKRESLHLDVRCKHPNRSFMTNNFLIKRSTLAEIKFEERLEQYGHEDTLFGFQLKINNICITHIDNPVLNGHLEHNSEFLIKTEHGLENLISILSYVDHHHGYINDVTLLNFYHQCRKKRITPLIIVVFSASQSFLKIFLSTGFAGLWLFDFYKLGFFTSLNAKTEKEQCK
jgi:glycosyltransferase involved in cell wall biosynthesis